MTKAKKRTSFLSRAMMRLRRTPAARKQRRTRVNSMQQRMARLEVISGSLERSVESLSRKDKTIHVAPQVVTKADVDELTVALERTGVAIAGIGREIDRLRDDVHAELVAAKKEIAALRIQASTPAKALT